MNAISGESVTVVREGRTLLRDVSFGVAHGEVVALVGPNGAGKSTLLGCLAGDIEPDGGRVLLGGVPLAEVTLRERARRRAVLPQQSLLQFAFRAREVVAMGRTPVAPVSREADDAAVDNALDRTEMLPLADRIYPRLSGGEQHRVSLARILAQEAPILLLDEPTATLDIRHQHQVMATAREVAAAGGAVLAIVHDLNLALTYANRVGVLRQGELVACDVPAVVAREDLLSDVFEHPIQVLEGPSGLLVVPQPRLPVIGSV